tara:strand:+ start:1559 stop:1873 length:315 start_codon:yes stop_codon:yes gene_type:complete
MLYLKIKVMRKLKYSDKVKKASSIRTAILSLKEDERIKVAYKDDVYEIKAYSSYGGDMAYSVWNSFRGMNVSKVGNTSLSLYSYDMMSQKTTYRMSLLDIEMAF